MRRMYGAPGRGGWMQFCHPYPVFQGIPPYGVPYPGYGAEYGAQATTDEEAIFLKEQAALLKEELKAVQERLEELGTQETGSTDKAE